MADNLPVSQLQDKTGNTYDIAAKRFSGTRTLTLTGDVTGSVTDNFSGDVSISVGIADNAIDTSCIADGAVTVSKIADTAVTESKLSTELQTKIDTASDASHTHSNKALLDTYTQTEANLADAVSKKHSHANSAVLSKYAGGKGSASIPVYIASDGTPTACTDDFARDSEVALKEDKSNKVTSWSATTTDAHYPSEKLVKTALDGKQGTLAFDGTYNASTNKVATVSSITDRINQLDSTVTSTDGTNVQVKVTETNGQISAVNVTTDNTENKNNKVTAWSSTTSDTKYPSEKLVKTSLDGKQATLPTTGIASSTYAINISGNAATATSATSDSSGQNIVDTYATKTEVDGKNSLAATLLVDGDDILSKGSNRKKELYRYTSRTGISNLPGTQSSGFVEISSAFDGDRKFTVYPTGADCYYFRELNDDDWTKVYYSAANTYSSTSEQPISGKGVKEALDGTFKTASFGIWDSGISYYKILEMRRTVLAGQGCVIYVQSRDSSEGDVSGFLIVRETNNSTYGTADVKYVAMAGTHSPNLRFYYTLDSVGKKITVYFSGIRYTGITLTALNPESVNFGVTKESQLPSEAIECTYETNVRINSAAVGSSSVPVYVNANGSVIACTTSYLKAGKDADGNTITSTYATKTELFDKNFIRGTRLFSTDDVSNLDSQITTDGDNYFWWSATSIPTSLPSSVDNEGILILRSSPNVDYCEERIFTAVNGNWVRKRNNKNWSEWVRIYDSPRKSNDVNSFSTDDSQAYTGKAIAEYVAGAIGGNVGGYMGECSKADIYTSTTNFHDFKLGDWFVASEAGTYTYRVDGTNKTLANVTVGAEIYFTTDKTLEVKPTTAYELTANKSSSIDSSNTKYPTNNAVKTYVDSGISGLSDTYATKTEVNSKNYLKAVNLTSSSNIDTLPLPTTDDHVSYYSWGNIAVGGTLPTGWTAKYCLLRHEQIRGTDTGLQTLYIAGQSNVYFTRLRQNRVWGDWTTCYRWSRDSVEAESTSETKQAVSSKAVRNYVASATVAQANKVTVNERINSAIPLVADGGSGNLRDSWAYQYHDSANGAILCVGDWNEGVTEKAQLRLKKGSYSANIKNDSITQSRSYQLPDKNGTFLVNADVSSTYSATGTAPVNGKAIKAAFDANSRTIGKVTTTAGTSKVFTFNSGSWARGNILLYIPEQDGIPAGLLNIELANLSGTVGANPTIKAWVATPSMQNPSKFKIQCKNTSGTVSVYISAGSTPTIWLMKVSGSITVVETTATSEALPSDLTNIAVRNPSTIPYNTAVGSSSVPVHVTASGDVTACTTADLEAGKDGDGNTITSTYATKTELSGKQDSLPTSGTASATYAVNISGTAADSSKLNGQSASYYAKQSDMGATYISATETLKFTGITFS